MTTVIAPNEMVWMCIGTSCALVLPCPNSIGFSRKTESVASLNGDRTVFDREAYHSLPVCFLERIAVIRTNTVRLSIGTEHIDYIMADLRHSFDAVK